MSASKLTIAVAMLALSAASLAAAPYREGSSLMSKADKPNEATLEVEGGRLVQQAVWELIKSRADRISYEDPRITYTGDLEDITEQVTGKPASTPQARIVALKSRKMSVDLDTTKGADKMLDVIVANAATVYPGARFRVEKDGSMLHVLPTAGRDKNGNTTAQGSLLDTRISLPAADLTAYAALKAICDAVTATSGQTVSLGGQGYLPYPGEARYPVAADNVPARTVLKRLLDAIGVERGVATWMLLYDQPQDRFYLSIVQLPDFEAEKKLVKVAPVPVRKTTIDPSSDLTSTKARSKK